MRFRVAHHVLPHTFEGSCQGTTQQHRSALRHGHLRHDHRVPKKPKIHPRRCGCRCLHRTPRVLFPESCGRHRAHHGRHRAHHGRHRELHTGHRGHHVRHVRLLPSTYGLLLHSLPRRCGWCSGDLRCRDSNRHHAHRGRLLPSR